MRTRLLSAALSAGIFTAVAGGPAAAAPVLNTTNFISSPTYFNGFESIPSAGAPPHYTGGSGPYAEGGVTVEQIHGDAGASIWVNLAGMEGNRSWYPDGGDNGYTKLTLTTGSDFSDISLIFRSYEGNVLYNVLNNGSLVLSGFLASPNGNLGRIGFQGGGFDEVLLRGGVFGEAFTDGGRNALQIDSIKADADVGGGPGPVPVPEPLTTSIFGVGLAGVAAIRRRKKAQRI